MRDFRFIVSMSPHVRDGRTVPSMIATKMLAMGPALLWGLVQFDLHAVVLVVTAMAAAVATEALVNKIAKQPLSIGDGHAALVGLMLVMMVPSGAPWWLVLVGASMAILIGKMPFGPLGSQPISPALIGLLIVTLSWPSDIKNFDYPRTAPAELKADDVGPAESPQQAVLIDPSDVLEYDTGSLFLGLQTGPIGTISPLLILLGGLALIWLRGARWQGPVGFLLGLGISSAIANSLAPDVCPPASFQLFTGMAMFGAFFLCTEWGTTPLSPWGQFLFGFMSGVLALLFRISGLPYARVPFAIAIMSLATPLFDRIAPTPYGKVVGHA